MFRQSTNLANYADKFTPGSAAAEAIDYLGEHGLTIIANPVHADRELIGQLGELVRPSMPVHPAFAKSRSINMYDKWRQAFPGNHMFMMHNAQGKLLSATCFELGGAGQPAEAEVWVQSPSKANDLAAADLLAALEAEHAFSAITTSALKRGALMELKDKSPLIQTVCRDLGYHALNEPMQDPQSGIERNFMIVSPERLQELTAGPDYPPSHFKLIKGD